MKKVLRSLLIPALLGAFFIGGQAHAYDIIQDQSGNSTSFKTLAPTPGADTTLYSWVQGTTESVSDAQIYFPIGWAEGTGGSPNINAQPVVYDETTSSNKFVLSGSTSACSPISFFSNTATISSGVQMVLCDFGSFIGSGTLTAGHTYDVRIDNGGSNGAASIPIVPVNGTNLSGFLLFDAAGGTPPAPPTPAVDDGDPTSHIIRINSPSLYATTTSPISINFDAKVNANDPNSYDGYELSFSNDATGQKFNYFGLLPVYGFGGAFNVATSSVVVPTGSGWTLAISLTSGTETFLNGGSYPASNGVWTATHFAVGTATYASASNFTTPGYQGSGIASSTCAISFSGGFSLSDCLGYLFLPTTNGLTIYGGVENQLQQVFPFSYVSSAVNTWNSLVASTTANSPTYSFNYASLGIGSTTAMGNILPNFQGFGASTTEQYFSTDQWSTLRALIAAVIWLSFGIDAFFTVRNLIKV